MRCLIDWQIIDFQLALVFESRGCGSVDSSNLRGNIGHIEYIYIGKCWRCECNVFQLSMAFQLTSPHSKASTQISITTGRFLYCNSKQAPNSNHLVTFLRVMETIQLKVANRIGASWRRLWFHVWKLSDAALWLLVNRCYRPMEEWSDCRWECQIARVIGGFLGQLWQITAIMGTLSAI